MFMTKKEAQENGLCRRGCAISVGRYLKCTAMPLEGEYCPRENEDKVEIIHPDVAKCGVRPSGSRTIKRGKVEDRTCSLKLE